MKIYSSLFFLLLFSLTALSQTSQPRKIVYLRDGTNTKGTVTIKDSLGYVMVVDQQNETHYYEKRMIAKIEDEIPLRRRYNLRSKGYVCNIEAGGTDILAKDNGTAISMLSLDVVNSYLFSPYVSLGLGVGTGLSASGYNLEMVSCYADSRIYFMRSNVSPYLDIAAGYAGMFMKYAYYDTYILGQYEKASDGDHGLMVDPSLGVRIAVGRGVAMTASVGYRFYYLHTSDQYYTISGDQTFRPDGSSFYLFNALSVKAGFQF